MGLHPGWGCCLAGSAGCVAGWLALLDGRAIWLAGWLGVVVSWLGALVGWACWLAGMALAGIYGSLRFFMADLLDLLAN
jgi:hypothetical protein